MNKERPDRPGINTVRKLYAKIDTLEKRDQILKSIFENEVDVFAEATELAKSMPIVAYPFGFKQMLEGYRIELARTRKANYDHAAKAYVARKREVVYKWLFWVVAINLIGVLAFDIFWRH